ncbi:unnamed protein product, partial [Protopolystoma xenopodis]
FNVWTGRDRGRIERTWLDGTHRKVIVSRRTHWPNSIALDWAARQLYYVDAYLAVVSRVSYDGGRPEPVLTGNLPHPFGLTLLVQVMLVTRRMARLPFGSRKISLFVSIYLL